MKNNDKPGNTKADRIKKAREALGLTQAEFGVTIGVTRDVIANLEKKNQRKYIF